MLICGVNNYFHYSNFSSMQTYEYFCKPANFFLIFKKKKNSEHLYLNQIFSNNCKKKQILEILSNSNLYLILQSNCIGVFDSNIFYS